MTTSEQRNGVVMDTSLESIATAEARIAELDRVLARQDTRPSVVAPENQSPRE
jgi:hypothetical protein